MSKTSDKISGAANQAAGKMKQGVGRATGNDQLEAKGAAQELKGHAQEGKGRIKSAIDKV